MLTTSFLPAACLLLTLNASASAATCDPVYGNAIIIIDGDTVALPCPIVGIGCAEKVRLLDIDAPETFHPDCEEGLKVGLKVKARLARPLRGQTVYVERDGRYDVYGRTLGSLRIGSPSGVNAGMQLVREDLARPYKPGPEERGEWLLS